MSDPQVPGIPPDIVVVRSFDSWVLYYSVADRAFYVNTLDYHPEPLKLPLGELYAMLAEVEKIVEREGEAGTPGAPTAPSGPAPP